MTHGKTTLRLTLTSIALAAAATAQSSSVTPIAKLQSSEAAAGHREGSAFAGGPFVGAPYADGSFPGSGAVYFMTGGPGQKLDGNDPNCASFGWSIAIGGVDNLVIGAPESNGNVGMVKVFANQMGWWGLDSTITPPADAWSPGGQFGYAVAVSGDLLVVGAPGSGSQVSGDAGRGAVYVYAFDGVVYQFVTRFLGDAGRTRLGTSVDALGTRFAAGRPNDVLTANLPGSTFVYALNAGVWSIETELTGGALLYDGFGTDVDLDGTRLIVGAPDDGAVGGPFTGRAHVFQRSGTTWSLDGTLAPSAGAAGDAFGTVVDISADRAMIGAPLDDFAGVDSGSAHLFVRNATQWYALNEFTAAETVAGDRFGSAILYSGTKVTVGAPFRADFGAETGATYTFGVASPRIYCQSQVNSVGCTPSITFNGLPSATAGVPFVLSASQLMNKKSSSYFYSLAGTQSVPFLGGTLCVKLPIHRNPHSSTGGSSIGLDCTGTFTFDFSAHVASGNDPSLVPGVKIGGQFWTRDNGVPSGSNLTNAVEFDWLP